MSSWDDIDVLRRANGIITDVLREPPPDSFSAEDYADRYGVGLHTARRHLAVLVKSGALCVRQIKQGRFYRRVYWLAEQSKPSSGRRR